MLLQSVASLQYWQWYWPYLANQPRCDQSTLNTVSLSIALWTSVFLLSVSAADSVFSVAAISDAYHCIHNYPLLPGIALVHFRSSKISRSHFAYLWQNLKLSFSASEKEERQTERKRWRIRWGWWRRCHGKAEKALGARKWRGRWARYNVSWLILTIKNFLFSHMFNLYHYPMCLPSLSTVIAPSKGNKKNKVCHRSTLAYCASALPSWLFTCWLCKASLVSFRVETSLLLSARARVMRMRMLMWSKKKKINQQKRYSTVFHVA